MNQKTKKEITSFVKGFVISSSIAIASKLIVMFIFSETVSSWIAIVIGLICGAIPSGYYSAKAQGE